MCSHGRKRERKHSRVNGCISGYCELLSLQSAYPGGTEHFLSDPELNPPPGKTERPVTREVGAAAHRRDKEEKREKTLSALCLHHLFCKVGERLEMWRDICTSEGDAMFRIRLISIFSRPL